MTSSLRVFRHYCTVVFPYDGSDSIYLYGAKERTKKLKFSQEQMYVNISFEKEQLHFHIQGNI